MHLNHSFSTLNLLLTTTSPLDPLIFHSLFSKEQVFKGQQPNRTKQETIRQGEISHIEAGQGNLIGGKGSHEQSQESKTAPLPLLGVPQKTLSQQP